ncbi:MAG: hypothetical protein AAB686_03545, partial [Patescibacteria group bacterium]
RSTNTKGELTQNGRVILDRIARELRQAPGVVTPLPATNNDPETIPDEIIFQDGHDSSQVQYIRYYLDGTDVKRQILGYILPGAVEPYIYQYQSAVDQYGQPAVPLTLEDKLAGENFSDLEFWGDRLININLYLSKDSQTETINTSIFGRNL